MEIEYGLGERGQCETRCPNRDSKSLWVANGWCVEECEHFVSIDEDKGIVTCNADKPQSKEPKK